MDINKKQFDRARDNLAEQSLSDEKKQAILSDIYEQSSAPAKGGWILSPLARLISARRVLAGALVVMLLLSGTTFAVAGSLPGDTLYGVKVNVLEPVGLALQLGQQEKAEYRLTLLRERVEELKTLTQNSREQNKQITDNSRQASRKATAETIAGIASTVAEDKKDTRDYLERKVKTYNRLVGANVKIKLQLGSTSTDPAKDKGSGDPDGQGATTSPQNIDNPNRPEDKDNTKIMEVNTKTDSTSTDTTEDSQTPASTSIDVRTNAGDNVGSDVPDAGPTDSQKNGNDLP